MLLRSLKLKNIRSYTDQTIDFPERITLLAGDIGSGKSTLLLAIEFALFGISKPDLTGETLLRKGTAQAAVELNFQLENQNITIRRNLKKTKTGISQSSGHLIINNLKKELTPVELKTEIISLLHYPEELISKSKNYLFRYTLYTPQEEMKLILQDTPDSRLDTLRKIFNLDKYKKIRENLWSYLKELRLKSTVLRTRLEPLENKKEQLEQFRKEQQTLASDLNQLLSPLAETKRQLQSKKEELKKQEQQNQLHLQLKNSLLNNQNLFREKEHQQKTLSQKQQQLQERLSLLIIPESKEELRQGYLRLQQEHHQFLSKKSELTAQLTHCQQQVILTQQEISRLNAQLSLFEQKTKETQVLEKELLSREKTSLEKEKTEKNLDRLKQELNRHRLLLSQALEIQDQLSQLAQCPTCLQNVPEEHKREVLLKQQQQIETSREKINRLQNEKGLQQKQFLELNQQLESLLQKENQRTKLKTELQNLEEKQEQLKNKKEQLQNLAKENNQLINELEQLKPADLEKINRNLSRLQELLQKISQKQELKNDLEDLGQTLRQLSQQAEELAKQKQQLQQQLQQTPDLTETLAQQEQQLEQLQEREKTFLTQKTKLITQQENLRRQTAPLIEEIDRLNQFRSHLTRLTELSYWLNEFLIKITYTIEKQILLKIHQLFNALFQEWFSILVEDENFSARLDDEFTPIIEQNGYEIYFNNLSGGERTAASLSYRLALNKVINDIVQEIKTKDLLILDEPTDGFSSEQLDKIRDVLERLNLKQIILVSHESKIESFVDNVIRITKSEGVSRVI